MSPEKDSVVVKKPLPPIEIEPEPQPIKMDTTTQTNVEPEIVIRTTAQPKANNQVVLKSDNVMLLNKYENLNNNEDRIKYFFVEILKSRNSIRKDANAKQKYEKILASVESMLSSSFPDIGGNSGYSLCCSNKVRFFDELNKSNIALSEGLKNNYKKCP